MHAHRAAQQRHGKHRLGTAAQGVRPLLQRRFAVPLGARRRPAPRPRCPRTWPRAAPFPCPAPPAAQSRAPACSAPSSAPCGRRPTTAWRKRAAAPRAACSGCRCRASKCSPQFVEGRARLVRRGAARVRNALAPQARVQLRRLKGAAAAPRPWRPPLPGRRRARSLRRCPRRARALGFASRQPAAQAPQSRLAPTPTPRARRRAAARRSPRRRRRAPTARPTSPWRRHWTRSPSHSESPGARPVPQWSGCPPTRARAPHAVRAAAPPRAGDQRVLCTR